MGDAGRVLQLLTKNKIGRKSDIMKHFKFIGETIAPSIKCGFYLQRSGCASLVDRQGDVSVVHTCGQRLLNYGLSLMQGGKDRGDLQVLVSRSSSEGCFSLLRSTLTMMTTMTRVTMKVRPEMSQLTIMGLRTGSGSEGGREGARQELH